MRVLTCIDPVPASDGSCAESVWVEQPSVWPSLTAEQGQDIGTSVLIACVTVMAIKLFFKPSTHKRY